jgi:hypothetical protein
MIPFVAPAPHPHALAHSLICARIRRVALLYSSILAKISASLKRKYSYKRKHQSALPIHENKKGKPTHILSNFNCITSPTRQQNPIARLNRRRHHTSLFIRCTRSDGDHSRFRERTRRGRRREEYSPCRFLNQVRTFIHRNRGRKEEKPTVSGLKRWTRTRSKRGTRDLIDLNVAWATEALFILIQKDEISDCKLKKKILHTMTLYDLKVRRAIKRIKADATKRRERILSGQFQATYAGVNKIRDYLS